MDYDKLENFSYTELRKIAEDMDLPIKRSRAQMIEDIKQGLIEYENYSRRKIDRYTRLKQLGNKGKEGTTFLVESTKDGRQYAMKTFRKQKSSANLRKEAFLQKMAADEGAAPNVIDTDTVSKYIVMDKMDKHLIDIMKNQGGELREEQQKQIIKLFKKLDKARVFHGDSNPLNYMIKGRRMYMIDYGLASEINSGLIRKLKTETPNMELMLLGLVLKLKDLGCSPASYDLLKRYLTEEQRTKFRV